MTMSTEEHYIITHYTWNDDYMGCLSVFRHWVQCYLNWKLAS